MIGSLLSLCVGFLCTAILTRLISTVEMGKYSMYTTVGTLVVSIVYLGLDQADREQIDGANAYIERTINYVLGSNG